MPSLPRLPWPDVSEPATAPCMGWGEASGQALGAG